MGRLEKAIEMAARWHDGQKDKAGQPYIIHSLSVMFRVRRSGGSEDAQIAGVLHDVVEDCDDVDLNDIDHYFGAHVADLVDSLTRRQGETYEAFIRRVSLNGTAVQVKLADIEDNMEESRSSWATTSPEAMNKLSKLRDRYRAARAVLINATYSTAPQSTAPAPPADPLADQSAATSPSYPGTRRS